MRIATATETDKDRRKLPSRKMLGLPGVVNSMPDAIGAWADRYLALAVVGVRSPEVTDKISLHLERFRAWFADAYGHERLSAVVRRDVVGWRDHLNDGCSLASSTVNAHLASLSGFTTWVGAQAAAPLPGGDPTKGVATLALPPLEPRALTPSQVRSLKSLLDRLERFHQLKGRRAHREVGTARVHGHSRPLRDRAILYVLLSTGLRRQEVVRLELAQVDSCDPAVLRAAKKARIIGVQGKGRTQRTVFLSADARAALADYLERERPRDVSAEATALFLSAASLASRRIDGRLSPRAINLICEQIGRWHDSEHADASRHVSPLRPHDLRHTFAFALAQATGADAYELERRLGHRSQRYLARYTNPPEDVAAAYVEGL